MSDWLDVGADPDEWEPEICENCHEEMEDPAMTSESEVMRTDFVAIWVDTSDSEFGWVNHPEIVARPGWDVVKITWITVCPHCGHAHRDAFMGSKNREKGVWLPDDTDESMFAAVESPDYKVRVKAIPDDTDIPI